MLLRFIKNKKKIEPLTLKIMKNMKKYHLK